MDAQTKEIIQKRGRECCDRMLAGGKDLLREHIGIMKNSLKHFAQTGEADAAENARAALAYAESLLLK